MFNSHLICVQIVHMVSIDVPAGVGAPPLPHLTHNFMQNAISGGNDVIVVDRGLSYGEIEN